MTEKKQTLEVVKLEFDIIDLEQIKGGLQNFEPFHDGCGWFAGNCGAGTGCGLMFGRCAPTQPEDSLD